MTEENHEVEKSEQPPAPSPEEESEVAETAETAEAAEAAEAAETEGTAETAETGDSAQSAEGTEEKSAQSASKAEPEKKGDKSDGGKDSRRSPAYAFEPEEIFVYQPLLDQLKDESAMRRESACWILGELRYKSANKAISRILTQDQDEFVRLGAAQALEKIGDSWSVQAIIRGLRDDCPIVRQACIYALGKVQDKQAIYPLEQLIKKEQDEDIKVLAETALQQISGKPRKSSSPWERKVFKYLRQIELEPDNANAHHNLAVSYFHAKRYQESRKYCEKARQLGANVDWLSNKLTDVEELERPSNNGDSGDNGNGHEASESGDSANDGANGQEMTDEGAKEETDKEGHSDAKDHEEGEESGEGSASVEEPRE